MNYDTLERMIDYLEILEASERFELLSQDSAGRIASPLFRVEDARKDLVAALTRVRRYDAAIETVKETLS